MATSWKLPLAAAAGEVAEPPPPPPAGPASPPGPATSAARAGLGPPGVSAARREVQAAGPAGTCSPRVGGPGGQCLGGQGPVRVSLGSWGQARMVVTGLRALGSHFHGEENGARRAPRGSPPRRLHPVGACKCAGTTGQSVDGLLAAHRGQERPPEPRVPLPWAPPDAPIGARAGPGAGPASPARRPSREETSLQLLRIDFLRKECAGCLFHLHGQGTRLQIVITLLVPGIWGRRPNGIWALCKENNDPNACAFSLLTSLLKMCTNLRKRPLLPKPMASASKIHLQL